MAERTPSQAVSGLFYPLFYYADPGWARDAAKGRQSAEVILFGDAA
jgi:hypothetical protein